MCLQEHTSVILSTDTNKQPEHVYLMKWPLGVVLLLQQLFERGSFRVEYFESETRLMDDGHLNISLVGSGLSADTF